MEPAGVVMLHRWTPDGVVIEAEFTGAHLFHLSAAGCVLNDLYREAEGLGITLRGVRVHAGGGFDPATWSSTGIEYDVVIDSPADVDQLQRLLDLVDEIAEIPRALRAGTMVTRGRSD
jgi:uncharacterized OsmC-like protein